MLEVEVRYFKPIRFSLDSIEFDAYVLAKSEKLQLKYLSESEVIDKVYDVLVNIVERYRGEKDPYLVEVRAKVKQGEIAAATLTKQLAYSKMLSLYPKPSRLKRVGVKLRDASITWRDVDKDIYVFQGRLAVPDNLEYMVLVTEDGIRVITLNELQEQLRELEAEKKVSKKPGRRRKRKG